MDDGQSSSETPATPPAQQKSGYSLLTGNPARNQNQGYSTTDDLVYTRRNQQGYANQIQASTLPYQEWPPLHTAAGFASHVHINHMNGLHVVQNKPELPNGAAPLIKDGMWLSIFSCLCCFPLIGFFAILKSSEARTLYKAGDYTGSIISARWARTLACAAILSGLCVAVSLGTIAIAGG